MEIDNLLYITTTKELRKWLEENSSTEKYCWVICSVKPEEGKLLYLDVVETALCYGWIDGIKKKVSLTDTAQRISPRTKNSSWTELNKERVRRLIKLGLMTSYGEKILPDMDVKNFKIDSEILNKIIQDEKLLDNFNNMPELYKRIKVDNIQSVRKNQELYTKRLDKFIESLKQNKMIGQWHDNGRLLDY